MATAARITIAEVDEDIVPAGAIDPDHGTHAGHLHASRWCGCRRRPKGYGHNAGRSVADERNTKGLNRQQMADRIALEFQDGWIVNLGVGIPTMCSNTDIGDRDIIYHSENGVIGYGPIAPAGEEDLNLVNAGGQNVTLRPGAAVVHHADSFAHHPRRPHRCDGDGRLPGVAQRRLRQLED